MWPNRPILVLLKLFTLIIVIGLVSVQVYFYFSARSSDNIQHYRHQLHESFARSTNSTRELKKQQHIHAELMAKGRAESALGEEEIQLTRKYWELTAWLHKFFDMKQRSIKTDPLPTPYNFSNRNLWDPGFAGASDKVLAQSVWHLQLIIGNYITKYLGNSSSLGYASSLGLSSKKLFIGNMNHWPRWTVKPEWGSSGRISGCLDGLLPSKFTELEPDCELVRTRPTNWSEIDLIVTYLFQGPYETVDTKEFRVYPPTNIPWFVVTFEAPYADPYRQSRRHPQYINSYRSGSMVQQKYAKWIYYDPLVRAKEQDIDYSAGKSKMVAMLVSNCYAKNGRMEYARELQEFLPVDIFGNCGDIQCGSRFKRNNCHKILQDYRFYLAFENANCHDYVTEKLHRNGLWNGIIPIVMGASRSFYRLHAPQNCYIHVEDFASPRELAVYLLAIASNTTMYNNYFQWRGTGEFLMGLGPGYLCSTCAMLYYSNPPAPPQMKETYAAVMEWLPDFEVNGQPLCLPKGRWYWNRENTFSQ